MGKFSSFWQSFLPPTQVSLQTKDFPSPQMSPDTEFLISDNTHFHSNKQWWPKHRIMWLHSELSRILTRILIANTFHFYGTSLQRISASFMHIILNLQVEKWREVSNIFRDQEKRLGLEHPEGRERRPGLLDCMQHMKLIRSWSPPSLRAAFFTITHPLGCFLTPNSIPSEGSLG